MKMKEFLDAVYDSGYVSTVYYGFHVAGFIAVFIFAVWYGKRIQIPVLKSVGLVFIVFPSIYIWMFVLYWLETGSWGGNNIVRVFVYLPLAGWLAAKILRLEWKRVCDLLAFCPLVVHGVSHFGCIFPGCCFGYPCEWGLYNPMLKKCLFPIQIIEALTAWAIIFYLFFRHKRRNGVADGLEIPIMLILFGSTRFVWEFFRDNPKILWGCSNLSFHALFMFVVGVLSYIIIKNRKKRRFEEFDVNKGQVV